MPTGLAEPLEDVDFLAFLIKARRRRMAARVDAKKLLAYFGSLPALLMAPRHKLAACPELGDELADRIIQVYSLFLRASFCRAARQPYLVDPEELIKFALWRLSEKNCEHVLLVYLDAAGCMFHEEIIATGTNAEVHVPVRRLMASVLASGAPAFVMIHNHPSGMTSPSPQDLQMTSTIREWAQEFGITLIDHLIVGRGKWYSFRFSEKLKQHY
jgi:DNA repair protein RadC